MSSSQRQSNPSGGYQIWQFGDKIKTTHITEENLMRLFISTLIFVACTGSVYADSCQNRFTELLVSGNQNMGPVRIHITQELVGGKTSLNYHHSDGDGNGMTEMIEPTDDPWSLFLGDKMYMSNDKGKNWKYMNSYDAKKSRTDTKSTLTKDAAKATSVSCGEEKFNDTSHEVVEGKYVSTMVSGAAVSEKFWVSRKTGWIVKSHRHLKSGNFESYTTQVIELAPNLVLPRPEKVD